MSVRRDPITGHWRYRKRLCLPNGRRVRISGTPATNTKAAAQAAEAQHVARVLSPGALPPPPPADGPEVPTIREYAKHYLELRTDLKPTDRAGVRQILDAHLLDWFGDHRLGEIRQDEVDALKAALLASGRSKKTVNNVTSVLSRLLRYAARSRIIPAPQIAFHVKLQAGKVAAVPVADVEALLETCTDPRYTAAILLAAECGLRVGELRALQWGDLDELHREVLVQRAFDSRGNLVETKGYAAAAVPATPRTWAALEALPRRSTWCIGRKTDGRPLSYWAVRDAIVTLYDRAGLCRPEQPWHGLRHRYLSSLADAGVPPHVMQSLGRHKAFATTLRYLDTTRDAKRSAVARAFSSPKNGQGVGKTAERADTKPRKR